VICSLVGPTGRKKKTERGLLKINLLLLQIKHPRREQALQQRPRNKRKTGEEESELDNELEGEKARELRAGKKVECEKTRRTVSGLKR
jgi:hypothetical protein